MRKRYWLCRYHRTDRRIRPEGPYVYELRREAGPLLLMDQEAAWLREAMQEEGNPHLLREAEAIEGKELAA